MPFDDSVLPRKRVAATVLFFDADDRVLLVEPAYKSEWELPGGVVEADEPPYAAACREVAEELGRTGPVGRLLARRLAATCAARSAGMVAYLENGDPLTAP